MEKFRTTNGISFCGALTILFIALKLLGEIDWNWLWVLSPLWIPYGIWLILWLASWKTHYFNSGMKAN